MKAARGLNLFFQLDGVIFGHMVFYLFGPPDSVYGPSPPLIKQGKDKERT